LPGVIFKGFELRRDLNRHGATPFSFDLATGFSI
jgi:hypothetical protein